MRVFRPLRPGRRRPPAPISGSSSGLPKVMLSPEIARTMKHVAVIQCTKRSNALKRTIMRPERPLSSLTCRAPDRTRPAAPACRGWRWRRSSAASPGGTGASRGRPAAPGRRTSGPGCVTRPLMIRFELLKKLLLLHRTCGRIDRATAAAPMAGAAMATMNASARAPAMKRACARSFAKMPNIGIPPLCLPNFINS